MWKKLKRWVVLRALRGSRRVESASEAEVLAGLAVSENHPVLLAVQTLLEDRIHQAAEQVSSPDLALQPNAVIHTAGGLEWLREFGLYVEHVRAQALEAKEE